MHSYTILALAALTAANPIAAPEPEPQLPGLPAGLAPSLTAQILSLLPSATAAVNQLGLNVPNLPGPAGAVPSLPVPLPALPSLPVPLPGVGGGALPSLPVPLPGVGGGALPTPSLPIPSLPGVGNLPVPPLPSLPGVGGLPGLPALPTDPKALLGNVNQAIQVLQIIQAILGAAGSGSLPSLPAGVGVGSGNPLVKLLLGLVTSLVGGIGLPVGAL